MAKLRPKQLSTETANLGDVLTWNGTEWAPAAGGGGSAPLFVTLYVDQNTAVSGPSQDGSIGKPFSTLQAALDSLGTPTDLQAKLLVVQGVYGENVVFPTVLTSSLSITGLGLGFGPSGISHAVRVAGSVQVDGAEAGNILFLENCEIDTAICQSLYLSKSSLFGSVSSTPGYVVIADDVSSALASNFSSTPTLWAPDHDAQYTSLNAASTGDVTPTNVTGAPYLVGIYINVTVAAGAGTMDVNLVFTDPVAGQTMLAVNVDLTVTGPKFVTAAVQLSSGKITWETIFNGVTGTPTYHLYFSAHMTTRGNPV